MNSDGRSTELWIAKLKNGDGAVAQQLFLDVHDRLMRVARRRLGPVPLRWVDEEDVAMSAFDSFCRRAEQDRFPQLSSRHDLWKILVKITTRKAKDYVRAHRALKRGGGHVRGESVFADTGSESAPATIDQAAREHETPELIAVMSEECRDLLALLDDDTMRSIAVWKLEGFTDKEIAGRLGCAERTVIRKVNRIRDHWKRRIGG